MLHVKYAGVCERLLLLSWLCTGGNGVSYVGSAYQPGGYGLPRPLLTAGGTAVTASSSAAAWNSHTS